MNAPENEVLLRQMQRERAARKAAEDLLESKSLELYLANQQLLKLNATLEERVRERTLELLSTRDQAQQASHVESQFLANAGHALRTPLRALLGHSEMLLADLQHAGLTQQFEGQSKIYATAQHLLALIDQLLDFTKLETGKMALEIGPIALDKLMQQLLETATPMAGQNGNRLETSLSPDLGELRSDGLRLKQCLYNLLGNACRFTHQGLIRLSVSREQRNAQPWFSFEVSDSGIGMDADQLGRLFQPFNQGDSPISRPLGGAGLGLAIARRLSQLLGGDITVSSSPGQGSCFRLNIPAQLPISEAHQPTALPKEAPDGPA